MGVDSSKQYTVGSLFSGIGGICIAFSRAKCEVMWANEIDKHACDTYRKNYDIIGKKVLLFEGDVCDFIPDSNVKIDILTGGFPCQPYSQAGHMKGVDDSRGLPMFKQLIRVAKECNPRVIFLENVSTLETLNEGADFLILMKHLKKAGYKYYIPYTLNSKDYSGIAQSRNRLYIIVFKKKVDYKSFLKRIGDGLEKISIKEDINTIIDLSQKAEDKFYYSDSDPNKCISKRYKEHFVDAVTEKGIIYQYRRTYIRKNQNGLCPALTASMGAGGHNVPIILDDFGIRKLTPKECLKFQGFPHEFQFPGWVCDSQRYKQIGNSVTIPVIERLATIIVDSLHNVDKGKRMSELVIMPNLDD